MGHCLGTTDTGQKVGAAVPLSMGGELGPHITQCHLGRGLPPYQAASWSIQPFGHNSHGPKTGVGYCAPFSGGELGPHIIQCRLGWGLPLYQVASWSIQLFGHNRHGLKIWGRERCAPFGGELGPHLTMWPGPRPNSVPSGILIHLTVWPQYTNVTDRTDRQTGHTMVR